MLNRNLPYKLPVHASSHLGYPSKSLALPLQIIKSAKSFLLDYNPQTCYQFLSAILIEGIVEVLYEVVVLPGVQRPMAVGFKTDEIRRAVTIGATL
jgi:hypothetical protein